MDLHHNEIRWRELETMLQKSILNINSGWREVAVKSFSFPLDTHLFRKV